LLLFVDPERSDPRQHAEMTKTLDHCAMGDRPGGLMGFELAKRVHVVRARLSWLRAAYLVTFAALGLRYICMPYLPPLRAQLADPDATLLPPLALDDPDAAADRRDLLVVQEPYELQRSLAVVLGRYTVFLPGLEDPQPFMSLASALSRAPRHLTSPERPVASRSHGAASGYPGQLGRCTPSISRCAHSLATTPPTACDSANTAAKPLDNG